MAIMIQPRSIRAFNTLLAWMSDAESCIGDAGDADGVSEMIRGQTLQPAGTSLLSQANQILQNAPSHQSLIAAMKEWQVQKPELFTKQ